MLTNALPVVPLPLQQRVVDARVLLTVPWAMLLRWLIGNVSAATYGEGTHKERIGDPADLAHYPGIPASTVRPGTWWYETDRTVLYQARLVQDPTAAPDAPPVPAWVYTSGVMRDVLANKPTDLGWIATNKSIDAGFLFYATDYAHTWRWTGTAWEYAPGDRPSGEIGWFTAAPGTGWALCNGSAATRSTSVAGTAAFTTPNLIGAYAKGGSVYSGTLVGASAGAISGNTADESGHTHAIDHDHPAFVSEAAAVSANLAAGSVGSVVAEHRHAVEIPNYTGSSGGGSAHQHGPGTLAVSAGEPAHVDLLPYFRL